MFKREKSKDYNETFVKNFDEQKKEDIELDDSLNIEESNEENKETLEEEQKKEELTLNEVLLNHEHRLNAIESVLLRIRGSI